MPISKYLRDLRAKVGHDLLLVPSVTALIYDPDDRLLLLRHSKGAWVAPGGAIDPHETPADAVVREVWEETGLHVAPVRVAGVYGGPEFEVEYINGDRVSYLTIVFECRILRGTLRPDGIETYEARFFSAVEASKLHLARWAEAVLPDAFADREDCVFQPPQRRPSGR